MQNLWRFPYFLFWRETYPQTFPLSSCQHVSTIPEKNPHVNELNEHFVRVCTDKIIDHQYRENGARNIYLNYNKMLNALQINRKIISYRPFHPAIDKTLKIPEK